MEKTLLSASDPDPVLWSQVDASCLLTVEHAGRTLPASLGDLGLPAGEIDRHTGWDPGALDLALAMSERIGGTLVAQRYSRIVIDCNRPWEAEDLVPPETDGQAVPSNVGIADADRQRRWDEIHVPFHRAVARACDSGCEALIAVHSYDPRRRVDAETRPWPVGLLFRKDNSLGQYLAAHLAADADVKPLGVNEPYKIEDASDFTIPVHAEPRNLPHVLVEVRNDHLRDATGVARIADILSRVYLDWKRR
jgi:predicted N-formylglutamate amidohydrolase